MRALYRKLGTLPAQRLRLPVPNSPWKLTGRVSRTGDGTLYASFGNYLYHSTDEGRSWRGQEAGQPSRRPGSTGQHRRLRERPTGPSFWPTLTGDCPPSTPRRSIRPTRWSSPDPATAAGPGKPALP